MRTYVLGAAMLLSLTAPALAEGFYIVQNPTTKKCTIVTERPTTTTTTVVGGTTYTTRTEGTPNRELASTAGAPRQLQIRDVDAGDEQHEPRCGEENHQRTREVADDLVAHREDVRLPTLVVASVLGCELRGDAADVALRVGDGDPGTKTTDDAQQVIAALVVLWYLRDGNRRYDVNIPRVQPEARRQDADDCFGRTVERDSAAYEGRV